MYIYTKTQRNLTYFAFAIAINYDLSDKEPSVYYVSIWTGWVGPKNQKNVLTQYVTHSFFTSTGFTRSLMLERGGF